MQLAPWTKTCTKTCSKDFLVRARKGMSRRLTETKCGVASMSQRTNRRASLKIKAKWAQLLKTGRAHIRPMAN